MLSMIEHDRYASAQYSCFLKNNEHFLESLMRNYSYMTSDSPKLQLGIVVTV